MIRIYSKLDQINMDLLFNKTSHSIVILIFFLEHHSFNSNISRINVKTFNCQLPL